jgi:glycosyltransferase involved in cell wall biosynthesis
MNKPTVCVIIPAYNEELSVGAVIHAVTRLLPTSKIIVIDDGSSDGTSHIAKKNGAHVIRVSTNRGIGYALWIGLQHAAKKQYDMVVTLDGDGQHDTNDIPLLCAAVTKHADMALGSRYSIPTHYKPSMLRRWGSFIISKLLSLCFGRTICDPFSGFRVMNKRTVQLLSHCRPSTYFDVESLLFVLLAGYSIREVPVEMKPRMFGSSSITLLKGFYIMANIMYEIACYALFPQRFQKSYNASE